MTEAGIIPGVCGFKNLNPESTYQSSSISCMLTVSKVREKEWNVRVNVDTIPGLRISLFDGPLCLLSATVELMAMSLSRQSNHFTLGTSMVNQKPRRLTTMRPLDPSFSASLRTIKQLWSVTSTPTLKLLRNSTFLT